MILLKRPSRGTQEEMLEKASILELIQFERFCRDNALWDEMKKCFSADSFVKISWYQGSGEGFVDASSRMEKHAPHKIYNTQTWLNGDRAVSIMMATIETRTVIDGVALDLKSDAKLIFGTQKIDGEWYIHSFQSIYEQDSLLPAFPGPAPIIPQEEVAQYRPSYACLSYVLGGTDQTLPGIDRPELVEALYREMDEWLSKT